jgi:hypothetical protein
MKDKKDNVAEYLLSQWQMEDMIRANGFDPASIRRTLVEGCGRTAEEKEDLMHRYGDMAGRMLSEGIAGKGHLKENAEALEELEALHLRLLDSPSEELYRAEYFKTLPLIVQLRAKSGGRDAPEMETCFTAVYGYLMLRLQQREVGDQTLEAIRQIAALLSALSGRYKIYVESNTERKDI